MSLIGSVWKGSLFRIEVHFDCENLDHSATVVIAGEATAGNYVTDLYRRCACVLETRHSYLFI
jgi:hypothetical protein